jgi:flagellar biosynthesis/type III secretory pathway chaperone
LNTLAFVASIIGSVAWPVTLLIVVVVLLRNGARLAKFVKSIRFKDFELTLRDNLEKARIVAESVEVGLVSPPSSREREESEDKVLALAQIDTGVAILKSWQKLESALIRLRQHNGLMRFKTNSSIVQRLFELKKINESDLALFDQLRSIRNAVVHSHKRYISVAEVMEYDQFVNTLGRRLEEIQAEPGYIDEK